MRFPLLLERFMVNMDYDLCGQARANGLEFAG